MKTKTISTKSLDGAKGGSTKMFGKSGVQPSQEGVSAPTSKPSFDKAAPKGGRTGVMGKQGGVSPSVSGKVSVPKSGGGNNKWGIGGGSGHMFGPTGSTPAKRQ